MSNLQNRLLSIYGEIYHIEKFSENFKAGFIA